MTDTDSSSFKKPSKSQRSVKNYALQPVLQIRLGLYCIVLSVVFTSIMCGVVFINLNSFFDIVFELTGVESEVKDLLAQYLSPAYFQVAGVLLIYVLVVLIVSLKYTHKLVGPTVAFRRHIRMIQEGKFEYRTNLRTDDAFQEVAEDLNQLSAHLQGSSKA